MKYTVKCMFGAVVILPALVMAPLAYSADDHANHAHKHAVPAPASASAVKVPSLSITFPADNDVLDSRMAVAIETDADLATNTMSSGKTGTHLHIDIGDYSVMPTREQLSSLGGRKYVYVFDMPMKSGTYQLCVSWAGADHRTIASSVRCRSVKVR